MVDAWSKRGYNFFMTDYADRLDGFIERKALIRGKWTEGHEKACLLAALSPAVQSKCTAIACPASICPIWWAEWTVFVDDAGSLGAWPGHVQRYAQLAHRWHVLTPEDWTRLDYEVRAACVREAMRWTQDASVLEVCETVAVLCERRSRGGAVGDAEWQATWAASEAAWSAASAAAQASAAASDRIITASLDAMSRRCAEREAA